MGDTALVIEELEVTYVGGAIEAVRGVTVEVPPGQTVAILGPNGAGKTSIVRAITGLLPAQGGRVRHGRVRLGGTKDLIGMRPAAIVRCGVSQVMEGRRIFKELTVAENLRAAAYTVSSRSEKARRLQGVWERFPVLSERREISAGLLSGGEQQMLAIGRALMQAPKVLLLDEPSLGLAPIIVDQVRDLIREINERGTTVLLIEQNAAMALSISNYAYILGQGRVVLEGPAADLSRDPTVQELYLGGDVDGASSAGATATGASS